MTETGPTPWGLIVGSSSGFGAATSLTLARAGLNIFGVHFDRRSNMPQVEQVVSGIQKTGREVLFFNINAADPVKRAEALGRMQEHWGKKSGSNFIKVFLHSVAFGSLKAYLAEAPEDELTQLQMDMTVDVMGNNLVYWVQDLSRRKMQSWDLDQKRPGFRTCHVWRSQPLSGGQASPRL